MPTRTEFQQLADERLKEASVLLGASLWSGAYYLTGYPVECGLKACILVHLAARPDILFAEKRFLNDYWTHEAERLLKAAGLEHVRDQEIDGNPPFASNWGQVNEWSEESRYKTKSESQAKGLFDAVTHPTEGVMQWIKRHW